MTSELNSIKPSFHPSPNTPEPPDVTSLLNKLELSEHPEGGYYKLTDIDPLRVPNPSVVHQSNELDENSTRAASSTIYYFLSPQRPKGVFHQNKARTVHTLHKGRGRYVVIHPADDKQGATARIETFVVGHDVQKGERLQWLVEGDRYKASFLLPDEQGGKESGGLLISETVVPGFEWDDHNFMTAETLRELVSEQEAKELSWLLSEKA
ncbi:MAG: hypothetical protein Q9222_006823 [Ikaeria aurantiellina]